MPNMKIVDEIRAKLDGDERFPHASEIAISEQEGTVTLRGSVTSFRERRAAVDVARRVRGVRHVADELAIDLRDHWEDDEIRGLALQRLIDDADVPAERIEVRVSNGWLTLKGEVKHQYQNNAAFEAVTDVPGIGGITNEIKVITAGIAG
jgi:osmotically-inducible protein OsmY